MKRRGFTLIELLAVIVVLAIIALIATPIVMNIIKDAKRSALVRSAENYVSAVDLAIANANMKGNGLFTSTICNINVDGNLDCAGYDNTIIVEMNSKKPKSGTIRFDNYEIGNVVLNYGDNNVVLTNKTGNLEYMEVPTSVSFGEDSWDVIALNVKIGNISKYTVGSIKNIELDIDGDGEKTAYTVRVANTSTPEECNEEGFSQSACGFVVEFVKTIANHNMNSTDTNVGGWPASEMRKYIGGYVDEEGNFVEGTIYKSFPDDLKNLIIDTYVVSGHGTDDVGTRIDGNFESVDKIYLLSQQEVWASGLDTDNAADVTRRLDYYVKNNPTTGGAGNLLKGNWWWGRTATTESRFCANYHYNDIYMPKASSVIGVSPAFRIG